MVSPGAFPCVRPSGGRRYALLCAAAAASLFACGRDSTGPATPEVRLAVAAGAGQFVQPGQVAEFPLRVRVTDAERGSPVDDVAVRWRLAQGTGVSFLGEQASDEIGIASVQVRAGTDTGNFRIEATADRLVGGAATFELRVVRAPAISAVAPGAVAAGGDVTITGSGFGAVASDLSVLFGGLRGTVVSATGTTVVARAPRCVLDRNTEVRVTLGAVTSNALPVRTVSGPVQPLQLARGQAVRFDDPADLACIDLGAAPSAAEYLVVLQDVSSALDLPLRYESLGITGGAPITIPASAVAPEPTREYASEWELRLRERERTFGPPIEEALGVAEYQATVIPAIGESREFNVLAPDQKSTRKVTAVVRAISDRAIVYVDNEAPSSGLTDADLAGFAGLFDDPIYSTGLEAFGPLSDIDGNQRVIIVFTPAVNALTPRQQGSFIAGYFYGCDLVSAERCKQTNRGEIFYAVVPDPSGQFGDTRPKSVVLRTVPGVLAHELQHMVNFSRRNGSLDVLWLAEGMAHAAEDLVGEVFAARGNAQNADDFRRPNYQRAILYLRQVAASSRIGLEQPGSLELRGGAWLFVKYLSGQYGGASLLQKLTGSSVSGAANVAAATARPWGEISSEFAVALYADGAPELTGVAVDPRLGFQAFDLRSALAAVSSFPPLAQTLAFQDFLLSADLSSAAQSYLVLRAPAAAGSVPFRFAFTGPRGGMFPTGTPALSLLRLR